MASGLCFIVLLCLTSGLLTGTNVAAGNNDPDDRFPEGWTGMGNYCYKFGPDKKTWAEAEVACNSQGGNLASFHNQKHLKFAKGVIKSAAGSGTPVWIGGSDGESEGVWFWRDGSQMHFMIWAPGKPDNAGGNENCMELSSQGGANDANCNDKKPYLCGMYV